MHARVNWMVNPSSVHSMVASSSRGKPWAFALVAFVTMTAFGTVACGPPPPLSPQEILRDTTPAIPLTTARLAAGAEASFGTTTVLVESVEPTDGSRDLAKSSVMDSLALVVSAADSVDSAASDIRAAAEVAKNGAQATAQVGPVTASVRVKPTARVRDQAEAVRKGASDVEQVASVVRDAASLALALGSLLGKSDEKVLVTLAATSNGIPHRATCTVKDEGSAELAKSSLSCAITRADVPPTVVWHLNVGTQSMEAAMFGKIIPASRGWLRPEPKEAAGAPIWISRPDESVPWMRRTFGDYASFALQQESLALARMRVADETNPSAVWLATRAPDEATANAVSVSLAILSLVRWPEIKREAESK